MSDILTGAPAVNFIAGQRVLNRSASVYERRLAAAVEADRTWSRQDV